MAAVAITIWVVKKVLDDPRSMNPRWLTRDPRSQRAAAVTVTASSPADVASLALTRSLTFAVTALLTDLAQCPPLLLLVPPEA